MMVMHFDANTTLAAVEGPRRSQMLASITIAHLVVTFAWLYESLRVLITKATLVLVMCRQVFKFVYTVIFVDWIGYF